MSESFDSDVLAAVEAMPGGYSAFEVENEAAEVAPVTIQKFSDRLPYWREAIDNLKTGFSKKSRPVEQESASEVTAVSDDDAEPTVGRASHVLAAGSIGLKKLFLMGEVGKGEKATEHLGQAFTRSKVRAESSVEAADSNSKETVARRGRVVSFMGRVAAKAQETFTGYRTSGPSRRPAQLRLDLFKDGVIDTRRPAAEHQSDEFEIVRRARHLGRAAMAFGRFVGNQVQDGQNNGATLKQELGAAFLAGKPQEAEAKAARRVEQDSNKDRGLFVRIAAGVAAVGLALGGGVAINKNAGSPELSGDPVAATDELTSANNLSVLVGQDGEVYNLPPEHGVSTEVLERIESDQESFIRMTTWVDSRVEELQEDHPQMDEDVARELANSEQMAYFNALDAQRSNTARPAKVIV